MCFFFQDIMFVKTSPRCWKTIVIKTSLPDVSWQKPRVTGPPGCDAQGTQRPPTCHHWGAQGSRVVAGHGIGAEEQGTLMLHLLLGLSLFMLFLFAGLGSWKLPAFGNEAACVFAIPEHDQSIYVGSACQSLVETSGTGQTQGLSLNRKWLNEALGHFGTCPENWWF